MIALRIQGILGAKLIALGRNASGRLINSLQAIVGHTGDGIDIQITGEDYWRQVEWGTPANKVPYTRGTRGRGGTSRYIQGLMNWIRTKGIASGDQKVKSIAFAIANTHKEKGNPVDKNKLGFISKSVPELNKVQNLIVETYQKELDDFAEKKLVKSINL